MAGRQFETVFENLSHRNLRKSDIRALLEAFYTKGLILYHWGRGAGPITDRETLAVWLAIVEVVAILIETVQTLFVVGNRESAIKQDEQR